MVIVLIGIGVLAFLLWEPTAEGVNASATSLSQIYLDDPFLAYVYVGSIAFFVGLYQAFRLLGYIGHGEAFSARSIRALRVIKYCAFTMAGAIVVADVFLVIHARLYPEVGAVDGPEGAVMLGIVATLISLVVATASAVFEKRLRKVFG